MRYDASLTKPIVSNFLLIYRNLTEMKKKKKKTLVSSALKITQQVKKKSIINETIQKNKMSPYSKKRYLQ